MNAIPQKTHNYERIQLPKTPALERTHPAAKIEYLDERRAAKLAALKRREMDGERKSPVQPPRARAAQPYENANAQERRQTGMPRPVGNAGRSARRLTAAYEVNTRHTGYTKRQNDYEVGAGSAAIRKPGIPGFDMYAYEGPAADAYGRQVAVEYKAPRKKGVVSTILLIVMVFAMLAGILVKYAELSNVTYQNAQIENNISNLKEQLEKVQVDVALKKDLSNVQERARALGMTHPGDTQIEYVTIEGDAQAADAAAQKSTVSDVTADGAQAAENGVAADMTGVTTGGTEGAAADTAAGAGGFLEKIKGFFGNISDTIKGLFG